MIGVTVPMSECKIQCFNMKDECNRKERDPDTCNFYRNLLKEIAEKPRRLRHHYE